jgi:hypothetical protein
MNLTIDIDMTDVQSTAHDLMAPGERAATILQVSNLLRRPDLREQYTLVAGDLALYARELGNPGALDSFMDLMISAAERSALSASFISAKRFLDGYESKSYCTLLFVTDTDL